MTDLIGRTISHYEILQRLGAGGMGVVYQARDTRLGRLVALKFLPPQFSDNEMRQRFVQEARAASSLDHPSICTIHDIDESEDGGAFIVMGYYPGQTLGQLIAEGAQSAAAALAIARQIAEGLGAAHSSDIVHRDIKPANVLLTDHNEVKILDFGLAKVAGSARLTRTGTALGTLLYMSPEQLTGGNVDHRTDIWALGVVLFELVTGERLFRGDTEGAIVYSILHQEIPSPGSLRPGLPLTVDRLVDRCLQREPANRYPTAAALIADLDAGDHAEEAPTQVHETVSGPASSTRVAAPSAAPATTAPAREPEGLAVLDFFNYAADPAADWICGGIAESVTVDLKKLTSTAVVSRGRVAQVVAASGGSPNDESGAIALGTELGARWVVWGGFQKAAEALRVTAHFLDTASGETLGSVKLDGSMSDLFALQDRIIEALSESVDLALAATGARQTPRQQTDDLEAFEYCARGRQLIWQLDPSNFAAAEDALARAIEIDPSYALAYSGLGQLHSMRFIATTDPADLDRAIDSLQRARDLDPELSDTYLWLSYDYSRLGRFEDAIQAGQRAVELDEENAMGHYFLGVAYWLEAAAAYRLGARFDAVRCLLRTVELAPMDQPAQQILGELHQQVGLDAEAEAHWRRAAEIEGSGSFQNARFVGGHTGLALLQLRQGDLEGAECNLEHARRILESTPHVYTKAMLAATIWGQSELARRRHEFDRALQLAVESGRLVAGNPNALGIGWFGIHAHISRALAFQRLNMRSEAERSFAAATHSFSTRADFDFSGIWHGGNASVLYMFAAYHAVSQHPGQVEEALREAIRNGWCEVARFDADPAFETVRNDPGVGLVLDEARTEQIHQADRIHSDRVH